MAATIQTLPQNMMDEMNAIKKSLSQYPGHKMVASSLGKFISHDMVAGLIGCIIPESGSNHTILNEKEYRINVEKLQKEVSNEATWDNIINEIEKLCGK